MTIDRQDRIRAKIKYLETIKKSLQEMRNEEIQELRDMPLLLSHTTVYDDLLDNVMYLSNAISQINTCIWSLEQVTTEVDR